MNEATANADLILNEGHAAMPWRMDVGVSGAVVVPVVTEKEVRFLC